MVRTVNESKLIYTIHIYIPYIHIYIYIYTYIHIYIFANMYHLNMYVKSFRPIINKQPHIKSISQLNWGLPFLISLPIDSVAVNPVGKLDYTENNFNNPTPCNTSREYGILFCSPRTRWRQRMETFSAFLRWIPLTKASDAELWCFLWSAPENGWENNRGDLRHHRADYDVIVMKQRFLKPLKPGSRCRRDCRRFLEQISGYWMDLYWFYVFFR